MITERFLAVSDATIYPSIPFDILKWSDHPESNTIVEHVGMHICEGDVERYQKLRPTIKNVILNLYTCWLRSPEMYVAYSRDKNHYSVGKRYNKLFIKYEKLVFVVDRLEELALIEHVSGFYDRKSGVGKRSRMRASNCLIELFEGIESIDLLHPENAEVIILRKNGKQVDYTDTAATLKMRERLRIINKTLKASKIDLDVSREELEALQAESVARQLEGDDEDSRAFDLHSKTLVRIFNDKFTQGGRHYRGWWQVIPKQLRAKVLIDGEDVVELDYKSIHPNLLYIKETGAPCPGDPYVLPGSEGDKLMRDVCKFALLVLINAKTLTEAKKSIKREIRNKIAPELHERLRAIDMDSVIARLLERHEVISKHFGAGAGLRLQKMDADIADEIMFRLAAQGVTCLPVFDSFLVKRSEVEKLRYAMAEAMHMKYGCHISIEDI